MLRFSNAVLKFTGIEVSTVSTLNNIVRYSTISHNLLWTCAHSVTHIKRYTADPDFTEVSVQFYRPL